MNWNLKNLYKTSSSMLILLVVKAEVVPFVRDFLNQTHLKGTFCALYINFDILKIYNRCFDRNGNQK